MKKVINGKLYDTTKAAKMASWENNRDYTSFSHLEETLYRKRTGEYFLHGEGEARTKYAKRYEDNLWGHGEEIIPLTVKAAQEWAEEHLDGDEYQQIFGAVDEESEDVLITFKAPASLDQKLSNKAAELGTSKSDLLRSLIEKME